MTRFFLVSGAVLGGLIGGALLIVGWFALAVSVSRATSTTDSTHTTPS